MNVYILMKRERYEEEREGSPISVFTSKETIEDELIKVEVLYPYDTFYFIVRELDPKPLETDMEKGCVYEVIIEAETKKIIEKRVKKKLRFKDIALTTWIMSHIGNLDRVKVVSPISYEHAIEQAEKEVERMRTK